MTTTFAKSKKPSIEDCKSEVYNRYLALRDSLKKRGAVDPIILKGCESMVALAAMDYPKLGIHKFGSRNTLIKYAPTVLTEDCMKTPAGETGLKYLDWLRSEVKKIGQTFQSARTGVERSKRAGIREETLALELRENRASMMSMTRAYNVLLKEIKNISADRSTTPLMKARLENILNNHFSLFGELFQPSNPESVKVANLVNIR